MQIRRQEVGETKQLPVFFPEAILQPSQVTYVSALSERVHMECGGLCLA